MFINRDFITSAIPCGADRSVAASARVRVTGNAKDAITATSAARNVLNIYRIITVLMTPPWLFPEWHKELIIRKNTRSGATCFQCSNKYISKQCDSSCGWACHPKDSTKNQACHDSFYQAYTGPCFVNLLHNDSSFSLVFRYLFARIFQVYTIAFKSTNVFFLRTLLYKMSFCNTPYSLCIDCKNS